MASKQVIAQLIKLRDELVDLPPSPWSQIANWAQRVLPLFRSSLPDHLQDYLAAIKPPQYHGLPQAMTGNSTTDAAESKRISAIEEATFRRDCENAKSGIVSYIDGLIAVEDAGGSSGTLPIPDSSTVFVVYGRNDRARIAMFEFLRSLELRPLQWTHMVAVTGKASPYIGEVLEAGFAKARAVVVLLTPDEEVRLLPDFRKRAVDSELSLQPRPNVILEAGMALGKDSTRTVLVQLGEMREISDILGRHVVHMNDSADRRRELAERLRTAGCSLDTTGSDWLSSGKFDDCLPKAKSTKSIASIPPVLRRKLSDVDTLSVIESWLASRDPVANEKALYFDKIDEELGLIEGSSKTHIVQAAQSLGYKVKRLGDEVVLFDIDLW